MKLSALVITYYPKVDETIENIRSYIEQVDQLIIWENTPKIDAGKYQIIIPEFENKIIRMTTGKNEFIAYPLNQAIYWAIEKGCPLLMSMDQDSSFAHKEQLTSYIRNVTDCCNKDDSAAVFGVNTNGQYPQLKELKEVPWVITSGCIYKVNTIKDIGGFREDYAIDCIDKEICFKARKSGYRCLLDTGCVLIHQFANITKSIFGKYHTSNYSPFRTYSIVCNHIILWKEYGQYMTKEHKKKFLNDYIFSRAVKIVLGEKEKMKKLFAIAMGVFDGLRNKRRKFS